MKNKVTNTSRPVKRRDTNQPVSQNSSVIQKAIHNFVNHWQIPRLYHQITSGTYTQALWATIAFCGASSIIPSNKLFFVIATLYLLSLVYITKSIYKSLLLAFIPFAMINIGQIYITTVIPMNEVKHVPNFEGRQLYFHFSPFFVLQITSIVLFLTELLRRRGKIKLSLAHLCLFISILLSTISFFYSEQFPAYSFIVMIGTIGTVSWLILNQLHLKELARSEQIRLLKTFLLIVVMMSTLQIAVGLGQYLRKSTLNLRIEQSTVIPNFGQGADENGTQFRPIGLQTHANDLANSLIIFLFTSLVLFEYLKKEGVIFPWGFELAVVSSSLLMILMTQSRTAYLAVGLSGIFFFVQQTHFSLKEFSSLRKKFHPYIIVLMVVASFFIPMVSNRLLYSVNSFGAGGGFTTRKELEKIAIILIQKHPLWGIGPAMFIPAAFKENPTGIMQYFPESVHNGYLLFISENGVFAFSALMAFFYSFFKQIEQRTSKLLKTTILAGIIATCCMMFLHPFQNFTSAYIFVVWLIVYIQDEKKYDK